MPANNGGSSNGSAQHHPQQQKIMSMSASASAKQRGGAGGPPGGPGGAGGGGMTAIMMGTVGPHGPGGPQGGPTTSVAPQKQQQQAPSLPHVGTGMTANSVGVGMGGGAAPHGGIHPAPSSAAATVMNFMGGIARVGTGASAGSGPAGGAGVVDRDAWTLAGVQFASPVREVYTRSLYRVCLKFTTSEDEDEGKLEPATAYWTCYGRMTTIGNGGPGTVRPDDICRRMDDSMTGPAAGVLSRMNDDLGESAAVYAIKSGMTCGWTIRGERGDAAVRVGKAKVFGDNDRKESHLLSLDAARWVLVKGASFAAGNSVFNVEDVQEGKSLTLLCTKGPMKGKLIDLPSSRCPYVFGRAHEADLCIMDRELSRKHGAIMFVPRDGGGVRGGGATGRTLVSKNTNNGGMFILTDLQSTNGSFMRLIGPYGRNGMGALTIGDEFIVGRTGFSVNRFDYGISEAIGARPTMEDRTVVLQSLLYVDGRYQGEPKDDLSELAMTTFAGVFDGHGGDECSNFLVDRLPRNVRAQMLVDREGLKKAIDASRGMRNHAEQTEDAASELMRRILRMSFLKTDKEFISPKTAPQSGSTAATILLMGRRLFACNVGDSRVVLCRGGGQCVELTSDHKPSRPDEAARVRAAGGFILHKRVMGELAITRAFGDKSFKMGIKAMLEEEAEDQGASLGNNDEIAKDLTAPLVSAEPEIASMVLSHSDEFLLLACDGLFDVFRSQDAIALCRQELIAHRGEPAEVARILSDQAIRVRRSRDNVSILVIILRPFWEN